MHAQYGPVNLKVFDLVKYDRVAQYSPDGADLIGIDTVIGLLGTYAPGGVPRMTSATRLDARTTETLTGTDRTRRRIDETGGIGDSPTYPVPALELDGGPVTDSVPAARGQWRSGPETDAELRLLLLRPRQPFILWAWDRQTGNPIRWLQSPRPGFTTDLANGPIPTQCSVVGVSGEPESTAIYFELQTLMSPCPTGSDRLILSHRWQMTHGHDDKHYLTRTIEGECVFNGAVMRATGIQPDWLRRQLLHPIPVGFERKPPDVTLSPDGLTMRYKVEDTDPTIIFDPGDSGATQVSIVEKVIYQRPTTWNREGVDGPPGHPAERK